MCEQALYLSPMPPFLYFLVVKVILQQYQCVKSRAGQYDKSHIMIQDMHYILMMIYIMIYYHFCKCNDLVYIHSCQHLMWIKTLLRR